MVGTPEEVTKRFKDQAQVQGKQFNMIWAQKESINTLKQMLAQLLKKKTKKLKAKGSFSKGKGKEGENSTSERIESENNFNSEPPKSSSEEEDG